MPPPPSASPSSPAPLTYAAAGVDLESKDRFTDSLVSLMKRTHGPRVIPNPGGFAGLFRLDFNKGLFRKNYKDPVLVACADGVGTKLKLAIEYGKLDTLGIDLVAMNINDMIVQGAEPLFFLDYIATGKVDPAQLSSIMRGIAEGCRIAQCALLGGETAEMAGLYKPGDFDLAGFAVGVVELARTIKPTRVEVGDIVLGLASDGIHSNGYTLVRKVVDHAGLDLHKPYDDLPLVGRTSSPPRPGGRPGRRAGPPLPLGEILLTPTRIYARPITKLLSNYRVKKVISGMAHITGSGLAGNLCRALHPKVDAHIDTASWPLPPVFRFLQTRGNVPDAEMRRVFNMGIGYCLIVRPAFAESIAAALRKLGEKVHTIGRIEKGKGDVVER
ncbi:MAG: phosphoribosylformylglycinamidine cyclo-ligase [Chloroflexi bacterium]|nr:phosphoribosylformylglycinamidine cyclo-ligase [Chloroflexota bacterium]